MMRLHPKPVLSLLGMALLLGLSACSETVAISESPASSAELRRHYEKTLTKAEQEAVISDLQGAAAKKQGDAKAEDAVMTGSVEPSN